MEGRECPLICGVDARVVFDQQGGYVHVLDREKEVKVRKRKDGDGHGERKRMKEEEEKAERDKKLEEVVRGEKKTKAIKPYLKRKLRSVVNECYKNPDQTKCNMWDALEQTLCELLTPS